MTQLLKIEWLKLKNYSAFIVISSFFLLGVVGANYGVATFKKNMIDPADPTGMISGASPYDFSHTWQTTSYVSGCLLLLPGLLLILLITNEFTFKTHRQNIIDGWSRKEFIHVKMVMALIAAAVTTLVVALTAWLFGIASGTAFATTHIDAIGYFFLKALSYNMIALLIGVLVRKTGFATGLFFIYLWLENFIAIMLEGFSIKLKNSYQLNLGNLGDYLPMNASDGLLHFPQNAITDSAKNSAMMATDYPYVGLTMAVLYLGVFYFWAYNRMTKTDL